MDRKLENKVGVIVGGTRGIGKAIALRMAELGMDIAVLARNAGELTETKKEITDLGVKCLTIQADAAKYEDFGTAYQKVWDTFGRFDLLVNSAGTGVMTPFEELSLEDIDIFPNAKIARRVLIVNFLGYHDFFSSFLAEGLEKHGIECRIRFLSLPDLKIRILHNEKAHRPV